MSWFPVPWFSVIGLLVLMFFGGIVCLFFATPLFPIYFAISTVVVAMLFVFLIFVQFLPILLPLLLIGVLLYMYAVRQGWIPADFINRAAGYVGGFAAHRQG